LLIALVGDSFAFHQNIWLPDTTFLQIWALLVLVWECRPFRLQLSCPRLVDRYSYVT